MKLLRAVRLIYYCKRPFHKKYIRIQLKLMGNTTLKTYLNFSGGSSDLTESELLALCSSSGYKQKEVLRLRKLFNTIAECSDIDNHKYLSREKFMALDCILNNPLAGNKYL